MGKISVKPLPVWMAFALVAALISLAGGLAQASHVSCGETLTVDTTLDSDLTCSGTALKIGADGITLDLGGHTLTGNGTGIGVDNSGGYDNVTIINGVIDGFGDGVVLMGADGNTVAFLEIRNNKLWQGVGILLWDGNTNNSIHHNRVHDNDRQGVSLGDFNGPWDWSSGATASWDATTGNTVQHNVIYGNGKAGFDQYGIQLWNAANNTIAHNEIYGHDDWYFGHGIYVNGAWFADGTAVGGSDGNAIVGNVVYSNKYGIDLLASAENNTVANNTVTGNARDGIRVGISFGAFVANSNGNKVINNTSSNNGRDGLRVDSDGNQLSGNVTTTNTEAGVNLQSSSSGNKGSGNRSSGNASNFLDSGTGNNVKVR